MFACTGGSCSGPANVVEVPYMEGFICKPDVRTLSAMGRARENENFCC